MEVKLANSLLCNSASDLKGDYFEWLGTYRQVIAWFKAFSGPR